MDLCTWMDSTAVSVLSTVPELSAGQSVTALRKMQNKVKHWYRETVNQPLVVQFFQHYMGGVDRM